MRPAFTSNRQAVAFALLLAVLLVLPALFATTDLLKRADVYSAVPVKYGAFPLVQQKVFNETGEVDIAVMGSSHLWTAIDTPALKRSLSQKLGREAEVFTLGWGWPSFDTDFFVAQDLMNRRHVKMLLVYDEAAATTSPHYQVARYFRYGQNRDSLQGLSSMDQSKLYGSAVLGMPRALLSTLRANRVQPADHVRKDFWNDYYRAPNFSSALGALQARLGYGGPDAVFTEFHPSNLLAAGATVICTSSNRESFRFVGPSTSSYQMHFAKLLARLCYEKGTRLVFLHTPTFAERGEKVVVEREDWTTILGAPSDLVGVPPNQLFAALTATETQMLFYGNEHFNVNGQAYFTSIITPALLELYARPLVDSTAQ